MRQQQISCNQYYLLTVEIKDYNVMIDGQNFFVQAAKNVLRTYICISNIAAGQGDGYSTGFLLAYNYFKDCYKMLAID